MFQAPKTAMQYVAAAVLGVVWLDRERDLFRALYQFMFRDCAKYVLGIVPIMLLGLCQALCSVMHRGQLFILTNHRRAPSYVLHSDWSIE